MLNISSPYVYIIKISIISMILLEPSSTIVEQKPGMEGMLKQIEYCGRISHKSEDSITETSYVEFIKKMQNLKHYATFEHGTAYLMIDRNKIGFGFESLLFKYEHNPYSKVHFSQENPGIAYITTNYRVICENGWEEDLKYMVDEPTEFHEKRITVVFTCDIGVSREYNRHRVDSILEESTRYCNYTKDKFGGKLNVMTPVWLADRVDRIENILSGFDMQKYCKLIGDGLDEMFEDIDYWLTANLCCEYCYNKLVKDFKWTPQQARTILPLDTKTTLAHTAFVSDWKHFFDLRALGTTGAPHPSAKQLAEPLMKEFLDRHYI